MCVYVCVCMCIYMHMYVYICVCVCLCMVSALIYNLTANHYLYADDTQLPLSSSSAWDSSHNITHLENTITNVSNRMSANTLSLNPSKN